MRFVSFVILLVLYDLKKLSKCDNSKKVTYIVVTSYNAELTSLSSRQSTGKKLPDACRRLRKSVQSKNICCKKTLLHPLATSAFLHL